MITRKRKYKMTPEPEEMFLGGFGKFLGNIGKGIGKGALAVGKGLKDFALLQTDTLTNFAGLDLIKPGAYSYGVSKDISNFGGNLTNMVGSVASAFAPPLRTARFAGGLANNFLGGRGIGGSGIPQQQYPQYGVGQFGGMGGLGALSSIFGGMGDLNSLFGQLRGNRSQGIGLNTQHLYQPQQGGFNFGNMGGINPSTLGQLPFGGQFGSPFGGYSSPGFAGGRFGYQAGGPVQGGLVDIQAERGELIFHPTGALTDVHARTSHSKMERNGNGDVVTDHPLEGSFIFSDYIKIRKSDADDLVVGIKRFPYKENEKGKEPVLFTVGDLIRKNERKITPAQLARRIKNTYKVKGTTDDLFDMVGDQLNLENRIPYIEGISMLSEIERERDDLKQSMRELAEQTLGGVFKAQKGGKLQVRGRVPYAQSGLFLGENSYDALGLGQVGPMANIYPDPRSPYGVNPLPQLPNNINPFPISPMTPPQMPSPSYRNRSPWDSSPMETLPTNPFNPTPMGYQGGNADYIQSDSSPDINDPDAFLNNAARDYYGPGGSFQNLRQQQANQPTVTSYVDNGSPFLRNTGQALMPIGGAINFGANMAGAIGSYNLYNNLLNENPAFYQGQSELTNQSRDIASRGNLFNIGLGLMRAAPAELPTNNMSRLKQFDPFQQVNTTRRLADQGIGQINSMIRGNADLRGLNIGSFIAQNNANLANQYGNAYNQQFQIGNTLDANDFNNANIMARNRQNRFDFANTLNADARQGFNAYFQNEASRPLDQFGLNQAQRQSDIAFREQRLQQPIQYASAAGQGLSNLGSSMYQLGTNYMPIQTPQNPQSSGLFGTGLGINDLFGMGSQLGLF